MEKNPYTMARLGLEPKENLKPNRDCGFYAKYFFFFFSVIEALIILGLVLFMVYGNAHKGTEKHAQNMSNQLDECNGKLRDLSKKKAQSDNQFNTSQAQLRRAQGSVNHYNMSLKTCNDEKMKIQLNCQSSNSYYNMYMECTVNLHLLNFTQIMKINNLEEQLKMLSMKYELDKQISLRDINALQERVTSEEKEKNTCQLERIKTQSQEQKFRALESKVLEELTPLKLRLDTAMNQIVPPSSYSCYDQELVRQMRQSCTSLPNELSIQLGRFAGQIDQSVHSVAHENGLLQRDKAACNLDLQERDRRLRAQQQHTTHELEAHKAACDSETKKMYTERQKLVGEKESLEQQMEQLKQACKVLSGIIPPSNRFPVPPNTGNWRGPGNYGNPGASATNSNPFINPSSGRSVAAPQPAAGTFLETLKNLGTYQNPLAVGTSGSAHGTLAKPDRTKPEENKRYPMESIKPRNQSTVIPVGQSRG